MRPLTRREALLEALVGAGALALAGCGASARAALRLDAALDVGRSGRRRAAAGRPGRAVGRPHRARSARGARGRARDARPPDRRARARRLLAGSRHLPEPAGATVSVDLPSPGGAHRAGARRCGGGDPPAAPAARDPGRRSDRQRPEQRADPRAVGTRGRPRCSRAADPTATTACSRSSTQIRSTTGPTSTRRATPGSCALPSSRSAARASPRAPCRCSATTTRSWPARSFRRR